MSTSLAWDERYQNGGFEFGEAPNLYLQSQAHRLRPGMRALAVGDGEGRNGVWLAGQGLEVTSVDWSGVGLAKAASLARHRGVALQTITAEAAKAYQRALEIDPNHPEAQEGLRSARGYVHNDGLTPEQRDALDEIRPGHDFLIRGGAGTGKTIVLVIGSVHSALVSLRRRLAKGCRET